MLLLRSQCICISCNVVFIHYRNVDLLCRGFFVFLGTILALVWNFAAVLIGTILSSEVSVASCFFAALYMVIGVPGAWYTWCALILLPLEAEATTLLFLAPSAC